jgi:hypothetical protein
MAEARKILEEMDKLLDQLTENAQQLLSVSAHAIEEEELIKLQAVQEELLAHLIEKDDRFYKIAENAPSQRSIALRARIDQKLEQFQELNARFIQNITSSRGMIQFKKIHPKT